MNKKPIPGGVVVGKSHEEGGEKFLLRGSNRVVELEHKEGVLSVPTMESDKKFKCSGTPQQIASQLNVRHGGNTLGDTSGSCIEVKKDGGEITPEEAARNILSNLSEEDFSKIKSEFEQIKNSALIEAEKRLNDFVSRKEKFESERADLYQQEKGLPFGEEKSKIFNKRQFLYDAIKALTPHISYQSNIITAIKNNGDVVSFTDKKGLEHKDIPSYMRINTDMINFDVETILVDPVPPYIPIINEEVFRAKGYVFDAIRIAADHYILATNGYKEVASPGGHPTDQQQGYILATLDQLALISDYYYTKAKATELKKSEEATKRNEEYYDKLPSVKRENFLNHPDFYHSLPAAVKKKITKAEYEALNLEGKERLYKPFKRYGSKRLTSKLEDDSMWVSFHNMYERFIDPSKVQPRPRVANREVFNYWTEFRDMMKWKIKDIKVQREAESETRKIALETSFGESNTDTALQKEYGILVKRQDGSKIQISEIEQIKDGWIMVQKTFGSLVKQAKNDNLKISHTGLKYVFASKAAGMYIPSMKTIAVSNKFGYNQFNQIFAHEVAHWIDNTIGAIYGKRYMTDDFESIPGMIARTFRSNLNEKTDSDYLNATKECFARAMEQYFSIENYGNEATLIFSNIDLKSFRSYFSEAAYVSKVNYETKILPLIKSFFQEYKDFFKYDVSTNQMRSGGAINLKNDNMNPRRISNQYEVNGKPINPHDLWDDWHHEQRVHFLTDHTEEITGKMHSDLSAEEIKELFRNSGEPYSQLPLPVKKSLQMHIHQGQYAGGGQIPSDMPEDSTEYLIDQELKPLIDKIRNESYEPDYRKDVSDYEVLGMIVSKFCRWDFENIQEVAAIALEDANFHAEAKIVRDWGSEDEVPMMRGGGRIESEAGLLPEVIADIVAGEIIATKYAPELDSFQTLSDIKKSNINEKINTEIADLKNIIVKRAEYQYRNNPEFRKKVKASDEKGRDFLYSFMEHWADGFVRNPKLAKIQTELYQSFDANDVSKNVISSSSKMLNQALSDLRSSKKGSARLKFIEAGLNGDRETFDSALDNMSESAYVRTLDFVARHIGINPHLYDSTSINKYEKAIYDKLQSLSNKKHTHAPIMSGGGNIDDINEAALSFLYKRTGLSIEAIKKFISENNLSAVKMAEDMSTDKLSFLDVSTAISGHKGNKYAKDIIKKYSEKVVMPKKEFVKEHKDLVRVLKSGSKSKRLSEAKKQNEELEGYMAKGGIIEYGGIPVRMINISESKHPRLYYNSPDGYYITFSDGSDGYFNENDFYVQLKPLEEKPLSTQLSAITGDSWNANDYKNDSGKGEVSAKAGNIIVHKASGLKIEMPPAKKMAAGGKIIDRCPVGTKIKTFIFEKEVFPTARKAKEWAKRHSPGIDKRAGFNVIPKENTWHISNLAKSKFNLNKKDPFRTITLTKGVKAIIGCPY